MNHYSQTHLNLLYNISFPQVTQFLRSLGSANGARSDRQGEPRNAVRIHYRSCPNKNKKQLLIVLFMVMVMVIHTHDRKQDAHTNQR